jgi:hypothetical protein
MKPPIEPGRPLARHAHLPGLLLLSLLTSCAGTPIVTAAPNSCATLLPEDWADLFLERRPDRHLPTQLL